ncbi:MULTISPECIES: hypothetical protein [Bacillus cereus group]|uniref:hypothetical protein n=1 Tax=Bacillus cereus group TaxID=86661 RepID=UPI000BF9528C|nr:MULTISPECIES: hypothetical protein [Bacillus cereus group]PEY66222.1 hypothetical protein CN352_09880 [Bacillus thuringiensis]PFM26059.1 hypothetical protein COJ41_00530 [Bacillus thuringiensis]PGW90294.1 hypothetical protein COE32_23915 [Bacillus cereus]
MTPIFRTRRACEILGTCDIDIDMPKIPKKIDLSTMSAEDVFNNVEDSLKNIANNTAINEIGENGKALLNKIEEAKKLIDNITNPQEMVRTWIQKVLSTTEDSTMEFVKNEIKQYEIPQIYQLTPLVKLGANNSTLSVYMFIFISQPNIDLNHIKDENKLNETSYGDLRISLTLDILKPNINSLSDALKSARFEIRDASIKDQITSKFQGKEGEIIAGIITNQFKEYLDVFKKLQDMTDLFNF